MIIIIIDSSMTSSVSATFLALGIIFSLRRPQHCKNYHHIPPFCSPSGGSGIYFPSLLAIGPSTIHSHWGFHAIYCSSGLPSTSQHHGTPLPLQPQRKKKPHQIFC